MIYRQDKTIDQLTWKKVGSVHGGCTEQDGRHAWWLVGADVQDVIFAVWKIRPSAKRFFGVERFWFVLGSQGRYYPPEFRPDLTFQKITECLAGHVLWCPTTSFWWKHRLFIGKIPWWMQDRHPGYRRTDGTIPRCGCTRTDVFHQGQVPTGVPDGRQRKLDLQTIDGKKLLAI